MNLHTAPCCRKPVDLPHNLAALEHTLVICPHCGVALSFDAGTLRIKDAQIEGELARLLAMLQDMQADPSKYIDSENSEARADERAVASTLN